MIRKLVFTLFVILLSRVVWGQEAAPPSTENADTNPWLNRLWLSGQANVISQGHAGFDALYSGPNSLRSNWELVTSRVLTLYTGYQLPWQTDFLLDLETAGGSGISNALGVAGFTNLDVVRNPTLGQKPYIARIMLHKTFALSSDTVDSDRGPLQIEARLPVRRLEVRLGKMSTADFFDINSIGSDSHLQFMNWAIDNSGAYDYAADTRGYTYAAYIEYQDKAWGARFAEALMPTVANGITLDWNLARARGENAEVEFRRTLVPKRFGIIRLLGYSNHANMGNYREAIHAYESGQDLVLDVTAHRKQGRVKYGFGVNLEQELTATLRAFGRFGWNEGQNESFAYTEVNQTFLGGADLRGTAWGRKDDKVGAALVVNGLSGDHRRYLALGGLGFLLGDGALRYGREAIIESYYNAKLWRGVYASADLQQVWNPGYNRDRGPTLVASLRLHLEGVLFGGR